MITQSLPRVFHVEMNGKTIELQDPNPIWSVKEVIKFYASQYPDIVYVNDTTPGVITMDKKSKKDVLQFNLEANPGDHG